MALRTVSARERAALGGVAEAAEEGVVARGKAVAEHVAERDDPLRVQEHESLK